MKVREILSYSDENSLERFVADKIDDVIHLRLPKDVLIDEISDTIASYSYVSEAIGTRHPPCFEMLDLLMKSDDHRVPIASFRRMVRDRVAEIADFADSGDSLSLKKNYDLYARVLEVAWESDREIDASESSLLTALRRELGISFREHVVVEHTEKIRHFWLTDNSYERERNRLLATGLLYTHDDHYVLPEEFPPLIRQVWSIDLPQEEFARLLSYLSTTKLYELLTEYGLKVAGLKEERIDRLVSNYVEPRDILDGLTLPEIRDIGRDASAKISGNKGELIDGLIEHFLQGRDLIEESEHEPEPIEVEPKALPPDAFKRLFGELTIENIYEIASKLQGIRKSGSKEERIDALWESPYSETTLLGSLPNSTLTKVLRGLRLQVSGPKDEKIARLIDWSASYDSSVVTEGGVQPPDEDELVPEPEQVDVSLPPPDPPDRLESVVAHYPYLDESEQIVLAVLQDLRSLNEHELERLVARYRLDWFLIKAQMFELVEKLEHHGASILQIKARGDHNVYEYAGV